jgi:ribosome-binding protein aMBF1 (putative translation factor)
VGAAGAGAAAGEVVAGGAALGVCARAASKVEKKAKLVNKIPKTKTVGAKREGFVRHLPKRVTSSQRDRVNFMSLLLLISVDF